MRFVAIEAFILILKIFMQEIEEKISNRKSSLFLQIVSAMHHHAWHKKVVSNNGGLRLTRLTLERQSKKSASTIFDQLVVNRKRNHDCTNRIATQTPVGITKQSVMQYIHLSYGLQ